MSLKDWLWNYFKSILYDLLCTLSKKFSCQIFCTNEPFCIFWNVIQSTNGVDLEHLKEFVPDLRSLYCVSFSGKSKRSLEMGIAWFTALVAQYHDHWHHMPSKSESSGQPNYQITKKQITANFFGFSAKFFAENAISAEHCHFILNMASYCLKINILLQRIFSPKMPLWYQI